MEIHKPGPNKRVFAYLLDILIISVIAVLLSFIGITIHWFIWAAYILFRDCYQAKSLGRLFAGLQVVDESGNPASAIQTIIRNVFLIIPVFPIIEYFVMLNDKQGRRIGDKVAKTQVNDLKPQEKDSVYLFLSILCFVGSVVIMRILGK